MATAGLCILQVGGSVTTTSSQDHAHVYVLMTTAGLSPSF